MKKKMRKNQTTLIAGYSVPKYLPGKDPRVEYYVVDLKDSNLTSRKRIRVKNIAPNLRESFAKNLVKEIYANLKKGWHPDRGFREEGYLSITEALEKYMHIKMSEYQGKEIRKDTIINTKSKTKIFTIWLESKKYQEYNVQDFTRKLANDFFDYLQYDRKIGAVTFNNYIVFFRTMFNVLVNKQLCISNPFKTIKLKKSKNKSIKVPLTKEERILIKEYAIANNKQFYLACLLIFHTGLRRTELTKIRISDIDIKNQVITVSEEVAKMKKHRYASMPKEVVNLILEMDILSSPGRFFLIGKNWKSSDTQITPKKISDEWRKMRKVLQLHPNAVLYSLRKTAAIQKAEDGMSMQGLKEYLGHTGMQAAAHYMENHRFKGNDEVKNKSSDF